MTDSAPLVDPPATRVLPPEEERNWAMAAHLGTLIAAALGMAFLAPLGVLLFVGGRSAFVRRHAVESLNFQISLLIYAAVAVAFAVITVGLGLLLVIPAVIVIGIAALVAILMGTMAASRGTDFRYPLTLRLVS